MAEKLSASALVALIGRKCTVSTGENCHRLALGTPGCSRLLKRNDEMVKQNDGWSRLKRNDECCEVERRTSESVR